MQNHRVRTCLVMAVGLAPFMAGTAQTPPASLAHPEFEVASVKPHTGAAYSSINANSAGRFNVENVPLKYLISEAWEMTGPEIPGGPGWILTAPFDVSAKAESRATYSEMRVMLRTLLEERFKLAVHRETKELTTLVLIPPKGSTKLVKSEQGGKDGLRAIRYGMAGTGVSINDLARALSVLLGVVVLDQTGLTDKYHVHFEWSPYQPGSNAPGVSIFSDVPEQLGLRLESKKGPVEILVIDHVEKPTEN